MDILHFAGSFIPSYGGTTTRLLNLLSDSNHTHYLYVPLPNKNSIQRNLHYLLEKNDFGNIKVQRIDLFNLGTSLPFIKNVTVPKKFSRHLKEQNYDLVHGHNPYVFAKTANLISKKRNIPFICEIHGLQQDIIYSNQSTTYSGKLKKLSYSKLMANWYEPKIMNKADKIITQTQSMKDRISTYYKIPSDKINIIPNGVNHRRFNPSNYKKERRILREENKWNNKIVFMYSGYLNDINGIKFFIESMKHLPQKYKKEIQIVILGRGNLEKYVQSYTKNDSLNVSYLGLIPYEEMPSYYAACDVFVIPRPSTPPAESLTPMKLLEAMAMEKIVLVSSVKGMTEIVKDNVNGFVYTKDDNKDFLNKVSYVIENKEDIAIFGKNARENISEQFNWELSKTLLDRIYKRLD